MPIWIARDVVLRIHDEQLRRHGGDSGFLNEGRLDAALARPRTTIGYLPETRIEELAAQLAVGIAKGHPFMDGNKRTAAVTSLLFLRMNGVEVSASEDEIAEVFENIAASSMSEAALAEWFMENTVVPEPPSWG